MRAKTAASAAAGAGAGGAATAPAGAVDQQDSLDVRHLPLSRFLALAGQGWSRAGRGRIKIQLSALLIFNFSHKPSCDHAYWLSGLVGTHRMLFAGHAY